MQVILHYRYQAYSGIFTDNHSEVFYNLFVVLLNPIGIITMMSLPITVIVLLKSICIGQTREEALRNLFFSLQGIAFRGGSLGIHLLG